MTDLQAVIASGDIEGIRALLTNWAPPTIASAIKDISETEQGVVFRVLPRRDAATVFEFLDRPAQERLLKALGKQEVADILNNMAPDDRTGLLEELPASVTKPLLDSLAPTERAVALTLLGYPKGSIGRMMTPHYVAIKEDWTVQQVLDYVRQHGQDSDTLNVLYIVKDEGVLVDDIRVREFLLAPPNRRVSDIMDRRMWH